MMKPIKRLMLTGLKQALAFRALLHSAWRRRRLLILAYHGLSTDDEHHWNPQLFMTPPAFRERMRMLQAYGCTVLPLGEAVARLYDDSLPARSVVITFDDGFANFYRHAYPILSEYGYPATVYLTTFYCQYNQPVAVLSFSYLLWKGRHLVLDADESFGFRAPMDLRSEVGRTVAAKAIQDEVSRRRLTVDQQTALVEELARRVGVDWDRFVSTRLLHLMSSVEAAEIAAGGIAVEMHMHYHCSPSEAEAYRSDLDENRRRIEAMTGVRPTHFCYPSGRHSAESLAWLEEAGVVSATTCVHDMASRRDHPLALPRFLDHNEVSALEFESWVTGLAPFLSRRVDWISRAGLDVRRRDAPARAGVQPAAYSVPQPK